MRDFPWELPVVGYQAGTDTPTSQPPHVTSKCSQSLEDTQSQAHLSVTLQHFPLRVSKVNSDTLTQSMLTTGQGMEIVLGNGVTRCLSAPGQVRENLRPKSVSYW